MIKKRTRPQSRIREPSPEVEDKPGDVQKEDGEEKLDIADLVELRRLRKQREGIDITKLNKGDIKKKRKKATEDEAHYGLHPGVAQTKQPIENDEEEDLDAKARRVVRTNNFTQQTNTLDVDKHMMAYIEENMRLRRGQNQSDTKDDGSADPYAELFRKANHSEDKDEGNVTNSMAMLTAIPEVDLGMDIRLKNIEETEKAKRVLTEGKERKKPSNNEEHLVATRFYRPNLKQKSDADIMRDAKMEAMGLRPEDHEPQQKQTRNQMATDEMVMERFKKRMRR